MLALIAAAIAGDPLIYGAGGTGLEHLPGLGVSAADAVALSDLFRGRPAMGLGAAQIGACTQAVTTLADVRRHLGKADGAVAYMDDAGARRELATVDASLACLGERTDPEAPAHARVLAGVLALEAGDADAGRAAFREVFAIRPDYAWDEDLKPEWKPAFEAARGDVEAAAPVSIQIVPPPTAAGYSIDGMPVIDREGRVALKRGPHLLQVGSPLRTYRVLVADGLDGVIVLPSEIPADALSWAEDPSRRGALSQALATVLARDTLVYVSEPLAIWTVHVGQNDWTAVWLAPSTESARRRRSVGGWAAIGGGVVAAAGGGLLANSYIDTMDAWREGTDAQTWSAYLDAKGRYDAGLDRVYVGWGVTGAGAGLVVAGLFARLDAEGVVVAPMPLPGGGGLVVGVPW